MVRSLRVAMFLALRAVVKGNIGVTILTILMLVLVALNLLFVPGLIAGAIVSANDILVRTYSGDLLVEAEGDNPRISHVEELILGVESIDGVAAVAARNSMAAEITFDEERTGVTVIGIEPEREKAVFEVAECLIEGSYLEPRDREQILLGIQIAGSDRESIELYSSSLRHVHAGDRVSVAYVNGVEKQYTVKGIFHTRFIQTDLQAFISQLEFCSVMPAMHNKATSLRVKLEDDANPEQVIERICSIRDGLEFQTWHETAGIVGSMTDSFNIIRQIVNVVNFLVAGVTVFIVTYVDVVNRRRQIGIQRAIGITPQSITVSYLIRALFYAVVGLIVAALLFEYVVIPVEARHPLYFPFGPAYIVIEFSYIVRIALILLAVSLVAAFIPVRRVMRVKILDAIWG